MVYGSIGPGCNNIFTTEYLVISHEAVCSLHYAWSCGGTCTFALYNTGLCNWPCDQWPVISGRVISGRVIQACRKWEPLVPAVQDKSLLARQNYIQNCIYLAREQSEPASCQPVR